MKRCSKSLLLGENSFGEMPLPTHCYRYSFKNRNYQVWGGRGGTGTLTHRWWKCRWYNALKMSWQFLKKLNMNLPYDPGISLSGIYLPKINGSICPHKLSCAKVHSSFFRASKTWKQPSCPSTGEQIKQTEVSAYSGADFSHRRRRGSIAKGVKEARPRVCTV